jgi:hypothetical protein
MRIMIGSCESVLVSMAAKSFAYYMYVRRLATRLLSRPLQKRGRRPHDPYDYSNECNDKHMYNASELVHKFVLTICDLGFNFRYFQQYNTCM